MRKSFVTETIKLMSQHSNTVLLLCDIGVHGFRDAFRLFPNRVFNIGILEQSTVSVAAGWALRGYVPIVHTIAPFLVERAFEQLKVDFGYQRLHGIFVGVGGSYDYASLGCTHHCPADISLIENIPNFTALVPGNPRELQMSLDWAYSTNNPVYIRMSERSNTRTNLLGMSSLQSTERKGSGPTVVAVGPVLDMVFVATMGLDVGIVYTNVMPSNEFEVLPIEGPVIVVEPFYPSSLCRRISESHWPEPVSVSSFGVPVKFIESYGSVRDVEREIGFTPNALHDKVIACQTTFLGR
jgi:transketolase